MSIVLKNEVMTNDELIFFFKYRVISNLQSNYYNSTCTVRSVLFDIVSKVEYLVQGHANADFYCIVQLLHGCVCFNQADENVRKYGKVLMAEVPQRTTELLKRLCTDYRPTDSQYHYCNTF